MIMKLGIEYYEFKLYTVYINDDTELTLTYITAMSNLAKLVFVLMVLRPRYQVSLFRTIGPLVNKFYRYQKNIPLNRPLPVREA